MTKQTTGIANKLGKAIARERTAREFTQEQLAEMLGVEQETISRFERGLTLPPLPRLIQLADIFEVPLEALLRGTTNRAADEAADIARLLTKLDDDGRDFVRRWVTEMCERLPNRNARPHKR
ncbi:helix-turn-helix domain-containing protein [Burkholderia pseudomallei]|uniref:helix-turn-helix domain-containing protein n=1 Tax=Burkholderia pseudomallei TaxID=28450 RepID=UPI00201AB05E|nr:helix-turn-helix transcriptional regulator [Burkholderia pseudomallei]MCL4667856.1 helix-turn-helix domain-containing protein [Burkholderia pseudomallei]